MKKIVFKMLIISMMLMFCASHSYAQYKVFTVKGSVEMSAGGKNWKQLKKKDELKDSYQIKMLENSSVEIIDSNNLIHSYAGTKVVSVGDIVKQRKTVLAAMNENSGVRKAFGGVVRSDGNPVPEDTLKTSPDVYAVFSDLETFTEYKNSEEIPAGVVFFITIHNTTEEDKVVNVYQKLENKGLIPCFPTNLYLEKRSAVDITDVFFGKPENNTEFKVYYSDK